LFPFLIMQNILRVSLELWFLCWDTHATENWNDNFIHCWIVWSSEFSHLWRSCSLTSPYCGLKHPNVSFTTHWSINISIGSINWRVRNALGRRKWLAFLWESLQHLTRL
jgi:hypothetical protein